MEAKQLEGNAAEMTNRHDSNLVLAYQVSIDFINELIALNNTC